MSMRARIDWRSCCRRCGCRCSAATIAGPTGQRRSSAQHGLGRCHSAGGDRFAQM